MFYKQPFAQHTIIKLYVCKVNAIIYRKVLWEPGPSTKYFERFSIVQ